MDFSKERSVNFLRGAAQALHDENVRLREEVGRLRERMGDVETAVEEYTVLKELVARQQQALFGRSSERRSRPSKRKEREPQTGHGPREQPELERVVVSHELPADKRECPCCGGELVALSDEVESSELVSVSDQAFVMEVHERKKYRCSCNGAVVTAPGPLRLVKGGRYSPTFAIEVAIAKYADHLPLERQTHILKRDGLRMDSQTLWDQLDLLAKHLGPTYEAICAEILTHPVIHADETRWKLLANGKSQENKLFQAWGLVAPELVAYRILDSRSKEAGAVVLNGYRGIVMADAYTVYQSLANEKDSFTVAHCWAHARRKFVDCQSNEPARAEVAFDFIRKLYAIEREANDDNRGRLRIEKSRAVVDELMKWARDLQPGVLPRSGLGLAIAYMLNQETGLRRFLDDSRIPLDNNACERALRGLVLGRKNHYGSRSRRGTEVAAIFYTLMESAKLANVSPKAYLRAVTEMAIREPGAVLTPGSFKSLLQPIPT